MNSVEGRQGLGNVLQAQKVLIRRSHFKSVELCGLWSLRLVHDCKLCLGLTLVITLTRKIAVSTNIATLRSNLLNLSRLHKFVLTMHWWSNSHLRRIWLNVVDIRNSFHFLLVLVHDDSVKFNVRIVHDEVFSHVTF